MVVRRANLATLVVPTTITLNLLHPTRAHLTRVATIPRQVTKAPPMVVETSQDLRTVATTRRPTPAPRVMAGTTNRQAPDPVRVAATTTHRTQVHLVTEATTSPRATITPHLPGMDPTRVAVALSMAARKQVVHNTAAASLVPQLDLRMAEVTTRHPTPDHQATEETTSHQDMAAEVVITTIPDTTIREDQVDTEATTTIQEGQEGMATKDQDSTATARVSTNILVLRRGQHTAMVSAPPTNRAQIVRTAHITHLPTAGMAPLMAVATTEEDLEEAMVIRVAMGAAITAAEHLVFQPNASLTLRMRLVTRMPWRRSRLTWRGTNGLMF